MGFVLRKILFCLLIINLFFVNGSFIGESAIYSSNIEIDQSFTYEIISSSLDVSHRREHLVKEDVFQYDLQQFLITSPITISVVNITELVVNYTFSCQNYNVSRLSPLTPEMLTTYFYVYFNYLLFLPEIIASNFVNDYNEFGNFSSSYYSIGLQLEALFFITTNNTIWTSVQEILGFIESAENYNLGNLDDFDVKTSYSESNGLVFLEGWFSGVIDYSNVRTVANNGFLLVFNKTSGLLYGSWNKGSIDGVYENFRITCHTEFQMELLGYDLPDFSLYDHVTPVFGSYMFYFGFVLVPVIILSKKIMKN
jgi:hypothetical protein